MPKTWPEAPGLVAVASSGSPRSVAFQVWPGAGSLLNLTSPERVSLIRSAAPGPQSHGRPHLIGSVDNSTGICRPAPLQVTPQGGAEVAKPGPVSEQREATAGGMDAAKGIAAARAALAKAQRALVGRKASEVKRAPVSEHVVQPKAPARAEPGAQPATAKDRRTAAANAKAKASLAPAGPGVVGIDPHKRTLTATVLDWRGGNLGARAFPVSEDRNTHPGDLQLVRPTADEP